MASALLTEVWTEEKCLQLIREYRERPTLWDVKDPFFYKKAMKPMAWVEISEVVGVPPDQCKHKMNILMSSLRREKAKIIHSLKNTTDKNKVYRSTWFALKEMAFLLDKETERKRNLDDLEANEDDSGASELSMASIIKSTLLNHHIETPRLNKKFKCSVSGPQNSQTPAQNQQEQIVIAPHSCSEVLPSQSLAERDEEIKFFTSFIGKKMKKYSDTTKNAVQQAICEVIFRADQNFYENAMNYARTDNPLNIQMSTEPTTVGVVKIQNFSDSD